MLTAGLEGVKKLVEPPRKRVPLFSPPHPYVLVRTPGDLSKLQRKKKNMFFPLRNEAYIRKRRRGGALPLRVIFIEKGKKGGFNHRSPFSSGENRGSYGSNGKKEN